MMRKIMIKIDITSDLNEELIPEPEKPISTKKYEKLELKKAWELANLTRIAYRDYECFNNFENQKQGSKEFTLEKGRKITNVDNNYSFIYTSNKIEKNVIDKYFLSEAELDPNQQKLKDEFPDGYFQYKILKTYEYTSYYPLKLEVEIDRFGFIAERKEEGETTIFVVFRGTRELAEWFNNAQFQQVNFLKTEDEPQGIHKQQINKDLGKISLGFNKMYTEFRPGILMDNQSINQISRTIDSTIQELLKKVDKIKNKQELIEKKSIYQAIKEFFSSDYFKDDKNKNASIYITGHSLGAALATIAAMDIAVIDLAQEDKIKNPINLYTFASPRVGDNTFAKAFNEFINETRINAFRFANSEDIVPKVPFPVWFKAGLNLDNNPILELTRSSFNIVTGGIFDKDYQHVGEPIYFTHQAIRKGKNTGTVGDNHNMTKTYCGALEKK